MELQNVICSTPEEFSRECKKWAGKSVIRGRKLIAYGEVVAELKQSHGGYRKGAGRKPGTRDKAVTFRLSPVACNILKGVKNKSEYVDTLIRNSVK